MTSATVSTAAPLRVLLVEDSRADARLVSDSLCREAKGSYAVTSVARLADALPIIGRGEADVVLLDLDLPDADGLDAVIRVRERAPSLPVVVLAIEGEQTLALDALRLGAQDYLVKGRSDPLSLERAIRYAMFRARAARARAAQGEPPAAVPQAAEPGAAFQYRVSAIGERSFSVVSPKMAELLGTTAAELQLSAELVWRLVAPEDAAAVRAALRASADRLTPWVSQFRIRRPDGGTRWVRSSAVPAREADGGTVWNGILVDVSEHHRLEEQLRQAQKMEAVGQLAGGIAHDFNNLLTAISSYGEMALAELPDEHPVRGYVLEIHHAAERAASLTRQLLAFSRRQVLRLEPVQVNTVVGEAERMLRRLIGEDVVFRTSLDPAAEPVRADRGQLEQVLVNLVVNARDAMPRGGTVTVSTAREAVDESRARRLPGMLPGQYTFLRVSDTGIGMDAETRSRIFEPFFTTKGPGKGTGLGLSTVYGIVKQLGGYVQVESTPGAGTTFTVYLPVAGEPGELRGRAVEPAAVTPGTETILLAEDEEGVRGPVRRVLERSGYVVLEASDGGAALELADRLPAEIDLLLTDVVMPGMGGAELARRLRAARPAVRVLFMSGYSTEAIATQGALAPGAQFIQKPFRVPDLLRRVREVLDKAAV